MKSIQSRKLNRYLKANSAFTTFSALIILLYTVELQQIFGIGQPLHLRILTIGLILYALDLYLSSRREKVGINKAYYFVIADFLWVVGSIGIILWFNFQWFGIAFILIVAVIVGLFGFLQLKAIRSYKK